MLTFAKIAIAATTIIVWSTALHIGGTWRGGPEVVPAIPAAPPGEMRTATIHDPGLDRVLQHAVAGLSDFQPGWPL
jgi:hypothetical protein